MWRNNKCLALILFFFSFPGLFSQEKISPEKAIIGKWKTVVSSKKLSDVNKSGVTSLEFFDTGICRDFVIGRKCNSQTVESLDFEWKIENNNLFFGQATWCNGYSKLPDYKNLKWVNDSLFYSVGREGRQKVYTYFRKQ